MALARGILAALILAALPARASIPELDQAPLLGPSTAELVDVLQSEAESPAPPAPARPSAAASFQVRIVAPSDWPFGGPQHPCVKRDPLRVRLWNSTCVMGYPVRPFWPVGPENRVIGIFSESSLQVYWNQQFNAQTAVDRSEDDFDRMTRVTDRWGNQIRYSYDANGNRVQLTDPQGKVTRTTFDALNRLSTVVIPEAGTTEYQYYRNSRLKKVAYPNGTSANYTFDGANRVKRIDNLQGAALVSKFEYTYDLNHNRIQQIEQHSGQPAETTTYGYDLADRLLDVHYPQKTTTYTYDDVGNRLTEVEVDPANLTITDKIFSYNNRNQLYQLDNGLDPSRSVSYGFDANGNQIQRTTGAGEVTDFGFDVRNQVIQVTKDGTSLGAYGYDFQGLRISKNTAEGLARYVYDDQSVLTRTDGDGVTKFDYGPDRLLSVSDPTEGRAFYLFDALGSVTNLTTPAGTLLARYKYDAWGNYREDLATVANPFGFTGHEHDSESGLIYAKARFYDPEIGIFLSKDPFDGLPAEPPSLHDYLYAHANPIYYIDPTGKCVMTLPCPVELELAFLEAVAETGHEIQEFQLHQAYTSADLFTGFYLTETKVRIQTYFNTEGTAHERATAANYAAVKAHLSAMTLGYSDAEDNWQHTIELGNQVVPVDQILEGKEELSEGVRERNFEKAARGGSKIVGASSQILLLVTGAVEGFRGLRGPKVATPEPPVKVAEAPASPKPTITTESPGAVGVVEKPVAPSATTEVPKVDVPETGQPLRGTNEGGQVTSRGSWRKKTVQDAWDNAEPGPTGGKACPTCGEEVQVAPASGEARDWDLSHNPSWTKREFPPNVTRGEVLDNYQVGTELECQTCNRGRGNRDELRPK